MRRSARLTFKLVAGPFMDRFKFLPMGFRRPWVMGARGGLALSLLALAVFPSFAVTELSVTAAQYSRYISAMGVIAAVIGVLLGPLIGRHGAKRFLLVSLVISAGCHVVAGRLTDLWQDRNFVIALYFVGAVASQLIFVAIIALFMNLCWTSISATQFSVYMALANLRRTVGRLCEPARKYWMRPVEGGPARGSSVLSGRARIDEPSHLHSDLVTSRRNAPAHPPPATADSAAGR